MDIGFLYEKSEQKKTKYSLDTWPFCSFSKDTVINSSGYKAVFQTWAASFYIDGPCHFHFFNGPNQLYSYLGTVRTNEERQVLFIPPEDTISYIIYDFSLSTGDTINWTRPDNFEDFKACVSQIDSVTVEDELRKRIHLEVFANIQIYG